MWIARDQDGDLYLFTEKPWRENDYWINTVPDEEDECSYTFFEFLATNLTWEDNPVEVCFFKTLDNTPLPKLWAARDKDGALYLYTYEPVRRQYVGYWALSPDEIGGEAISGRPAISTEIPKYLFPELKWDDPPITVELARKPKIIKKNERNNK